MAKKIKFEPADLLQGKIVTVVARKGDETRVKDLEYTEALKAKAQFNKLGYYCILFQEGFYQGPKTQTNNPKTKRE